MTAKPCRSQRPGGCTTCARTFFKPDVTRWYQDWILNYMVWPYVKPNGDDEDNH